MAVAVLLGLAAACGQDREVARVVRIETGTVDTMELLSLPYQWSGEVRGGQQVALVGPTTMLFHNDAETGFQYRKGDGEVLRLDFTDWSVRLAGQVVALNLEGDSAAAWLGQATEADLAQLRFVDFPPELRATLRPSVERLAVANPHVGLSFASEGEMVQTLPLFRPLVLWLGTSGDSGSRLPATQRIIAEQLATQRQVEFLLMTVMDSGVARVLGELPKLRHLTLDTWDAAQGAPIPRGVRTLAISDSFGDLSALASLRHLRTLDLTAATGSGASDLAGLKELRWIGFPVNTTQAEFDAIVAAHPDLEVVAMITDSVIDLWPLRRLHHLRAVTLFGGFRNLRVFRELPSLEFVGLSQEFWEAYPEQALAIQEALPKAVVVKVTPMCLGSGWILLVVPIVLLVMLTVPRRRVAGGQG